MPDGSALLLGFSSEEPGEDLQPVGWADPVAKMLVRGVVSGDRRPRPVGESAMAWPEHRRRELLEESPQELP